MNTFISLSFSFIPRFQTNSNCKIFYEQHTKKSRPCSGGGLGEEHIHTAQQLQGLAFRDLHLYVSSLLPTNILERASPLYLPTHRTTKASSRFQNSRFQKIRTPLALALAWMQLPANRLIEFVWKTYNTDYC